MTYDDFDMFMARLSGNLTAQAGKLRMDFGPSQAADTLAGMGNALFDTVVEKREERAQEAVVILSNVPPDARLVVLKAIRQHLGLGFIEAVQMLDFVDVTIPNNEQLIADLRAAGATVTEGGE